MAKGGHAMALAALKILLTLYLLYGLLKFFDFFFLKYETRIERIRAAYQDGGRTIRIFDDVVLILMLVLIILVFASGVEYVSFTTGLLFGITLVQVYFH